MEYKDLNEVRILAGLPLVERYGRDDDDDDDDDEGLSRSERELANKADRDLKAKGVKVKVNADKDLEGKGGKEDNQPETKPAAKPAVKKAEAPAGAGLTKEKKAARARGWLSANAGAKRGEFIRYATENLGFGPAYASTFFASHQKKARDAAAKAAQTNEVFILIHPAGGAYLGEAVTGTETVWTSETDPVIFESREKAEKMVEFLRDFKGQKADIEAVYIGEAGVAAVDWRDALIEKHGEAEFVKTADGLGVTASINERKVGYWNDRFDNWTA